MTRAGRIGARALLLFVALLTMGASAHQGTPIEAQTWANVKLIHLIFGAIGAAVMVTTKPLVWWEVFCTLFAGTAIASLFTPAALDGLAHTLNATPAVWENPTAALLGALGLYLVLGVKRIGTGIATDPLAWLRAIRGGVPPPTPSNQPDPTEGPKP